MALPDYILRKRTIDDIHVMREESLRLPENVKDWRYMLGILREEALRRMKNKKTELPPKQYKQWSKGYSIYFQAINDRIGEAKALIKEQNVKNSVLKNQTENSLMFRAIHESLGFIKSGEINQAQARLEDCIGQIENLKLSINQQ
ncbi:MAG: hypothetical protein ABFD18_06435 [Syntrophomonas sp.]